MHFKVNLFGFVTVWFDQLKFVAQDRREAGRRGRSASGDEAIAFGGPLEFVNELRKIIPSNGFSDPPGLSVTPSGISASYSLNMPVDRAWASSRSNTSRSARDSCLPFDAKPAEVRFNFAERQRPFSLTVSLLGGGGFFAIGVGTEGVREIEAALEFGAALSIDLGVASGGVEIKAGVYFHWQTASVELAGYVRLHGELSVLGLISASLTFNLQLAYLKESGKSVVWGEATLEIEIEILFFSFSVSVKCRREFGGSEGDPKFIELIPDQRRGPTTATRSRRRLPDMAKQTTLWTALPNGYSDDGRSLRVSLLVSPRLEPDFEPHLEKLPGLRSTGRRRSRRRASPCTSVRRPR